MYKVKVDGKYVYHPWAENLQIYDAILTEELNKNGTFDFKLPATNLRYDSIRKLKSEISILRFDKNLNEEEVFSGRVLNDELTFNNEKKVECEGGLAFTIDSILRPYEETADPATHFKNFITRHNSQVDDWKKFEIGIVTVAGEQTKIKDFSYPKIRNAINDQLINVFGGYVRVRKQHGKYYADYITDFNRTAAQEIKFGNNLLDLTKYIKAENVKTCIIPLGATNSATGKPVTIESVNGGLDYLCDDAAVELFGNIYDTVSYSDVSDPNKLKDNGQSYLDDIKNLVVTIELTAVDLSDLGADIESIKVGDTVRVISPPHGINTCIQVSKKITNLKKPTDSKITLGATLKTLTNQDFGVSAVKKEVQEVKGQVSEKVTKTEVEQMTDNINYAASERPGGSANNAAKLQGMSTGRGAWDTPFIPYVGKDGVMEVGKYIDFHADNEGVKDYDARLGVTSNGNLNLNGNNIPMVGDKVAVALTASGISTNASTCYYYPYLGMCFIRAFVKTTDTLTAETEMAILIVPDGYKPSSIHALNAWTSSPEKNLTARVQGNEIKIKSSSDIANTYALYVTGWWTI